MKRLWYELRLLTRGTEECLPFASNLGVMDLTLPALDNEPCDGTFSHPFNLSENSRVRGSYKRSRSRVLLNIYL